MDKAEQRKQDFQWLLQQKEMLIDESRTPNLIKMLAGGRKRDDWTDATEYALMGLKFKTNGEAQ